MHLNFNIINNNNNWRISVYFIYTVLCMYVYLDCQCVARARGLSKTVARVYYGGMPDPVTLVTAVYGIVIVVPATLSLCAH